MRGPAHPLRCTGPVARQDATTNVGSRPVLFREVRDTMLSWKLEKTTKAPIRAELGAPAGERVVIDVSGDQVVVGTRQTERCTLSVVVPTRNEALNVEALVSRLRVALDR